MDTLTFFSEITKTLVWPLAIVAIILVLKKPLRVLILSLRRFQYGELAIEFGWQVYDLTGKFAKIIPDNNKLKFPGADLLKNSARNAIARAVRELESTVREAQINKILTKEHTELYDKLMDLGQVAILVPEQSLDRCALGEYLRMVQRLTDFFSSP